MKDPKFKPSNLGNVIPGRYIIEFDEHYRGSSLEFVNKVEKDVLKSAPRIGMRVKMNIAQDYSSSSAIFRGVSICFQNNGKQFGKREEMQLNRDEEMVEHVILRNIIESHQVKHIYPVTEISRPAVKRHSHMLAYNVSRNIGLPKINISENESPLPFTHAITQVDKVHRDLKLTGKNIVVGIIDSGIDYRHPAFGSGFGIGFPVRYGYDLVGDDFVSTDPTSRSEKDTPLDACENGSGHGTHVAGVIAANDEFLNFTGIAPQVTLGAWRIFGCDGSTSNDLVIKALISAHEAGCDIINLSLGTPSNWADDPTSIVANRVSEKGSIVIAAAGNEGNDGAFYISAPGSGTSTVSVASTDNAYVLTRAFQTKNGENYPYMLSTSTSSFLEGKLVAYTENTSLNDACDGTVPDRSIKGHIVLVQTGKCTLDEKISTVQKLGASAVVVYDNQSEMSFRPRTYNANIPIISISMNAGEAIKKQLNEIESYKDGIEIVSKMVLTPQKLSTSNQVSLFSSVGPLYDVSLKPDIAGPGGFIFSTLPLVDGGYGVLSGTSMAAPFVTGAFALFLEAQGKSRSHTFIKEHFQNYAQPIMQGSLFDNPARQGAGLIQVFDAINQPIHISPGHISFNDTNNIKTQTLTISNPSKETVSFEISHEAGLSLAPFFARNQHFIPLSPSKSTAEHITANLELSPTNITLAPGVQGSLSEAPIFAAGFPRVIAGSELHAISKIKGDNDEIKQTLLIDRSNKSSSEISILYRLLTGTARIKTEVLDENLQMIGTASDDRFVPRNTLDGYIFIDRWNATVVPLGSDNISDLQPLSNGSYYLRWKALKLLSDPSSEGSWETQLSPLILVQ
ncbi:hypothetical protein RO3G_16312 [Rhizopus delemar RA 99-880]|uniref:Peptidase S8/S53 domain-containing protein n=1 Tax=Rhizopus delemar (strain RA 99-880 / ATCC MYA-4621 / FGSC 9543 / NRRL 43880) TaxID=246409 RepID=I1CT21_RHIO9|nr:hypothetical protein RO3G_16312 [Rhizopus delemar RA 99-880]|eukprot:EIE91601.1 hypothetical protein RO3G_16312 [Rhizopus delemar RA 99-880]